MGCGGKAKKSMDGENDPEVNASNIWESAVKAKRTTKRGKILCNSRLYLDMGRVSKYSIPPCFRSNENNDKPINTDRISKPTWSTGKKDWA